MFAIHQHFRLDDRHNACFLAKRRITRQRVRVRLDAVPAWRGVRDGDHRPPFGEACAGLVIVGQPLAQPVQPFGDLLDARSGKRFRALVHLDARHRSGIADQFDQRCAIGSFLVERLLEQDDA